MKFLSLCIVTIAFIFVGCGSSTTGSKTEEKIEKQAQNFSMKIGDTVELSNGTFKKDILSYTWMEDGVVIGTKSNIDYTPTKSDKHIITLITVDKNGKKEITTIIIFVDKDSDEVSKTEENTTTGSANKFDYKNIKINELLPANIDIKLDPLYNQFSDYIELYNGNELSVDVGGFYLSDSDDPKKWQLPMNTIIPKHGYLLIWADKKDNLLHTNFKLSLKKESVTFADKNGVILDTISYEKLKGNIAITHKGEDIFYMKPTPNMKNDKTFKSILQTNNPTYSIDGGVYTSSLSVVLSTENSASIYYTLDGTKPTKKSLKYIKPIDISKSSIIKAISFSDDKLPSEMVSKSFIIDSKNIQPNLPIISISMDNTNLFDDHKGIYVVGTNGVALTQCQDDATVPKNYAQDWQRPSYIEYFDKDRVKQFDFGADIAIAGQCSRDVVQKSFKIELDKKYGVKSFKYKLFDDKKIDKFKDFKLRVGYEGHYIADMLAAAIVKSGGFDIDYQAYQTSQVYLNGKYWGLYNIRESKGSDFLKSNYKKIDKDNIDIINRGTKVKKGDMKEYNKLKSFVQNHDLSIVSNYQEIEKMVDIDSFIDYMTLMIYSANPDWIWSNHRCWREKKDGAKWRWMLDDLDLSFNIDEDSKNYFDIATGKGPVLTQLFKRLLKNQTFKDRFSSRFQTALNSSFTPSKIHKMVDDLVLIRDNYNNLSKRWMTRSDEKVFITNNVRPFIDRRVDTLRAQIGAKLSLKGKNTITIEKPINGYIIIDNTKLNETFSGVYFDDTNATLKAVAKDGYEFVKWEDNSTSVDRNFTVIPNSTIFATFKPKI